MLSQADGYIIQARVPDRLPTLLPETYFFLVKGPPPGALLAVMASEMTRRVKASLASARGFAEALVLPRLIPRGSLTDDSANPASTFF